MSKNIKPRVRVSKNIKKGDIFEVKTLVSHAMETGTRKDKQGQVIPRDIINEMKVEYDGKEVLRADWYPAVSANPYSSFNVKAGNSGPMVITWTDDAGEKYTKTVDIKVG